MAIYIVVDLETKDERLVETPTATSAENYAANITRERFKATKVNAVQLPDLLRRLPLEGPGREPLDLTQ